MPWITIDQNTKQKQRRNKFSSGFKNGPSKRNLKRIKHKVGGKQREQMSKDLEVGTDGEMEES